MGQTQNIGKRIELIPMDPHFHDISMGLYLREADEATEFLVHTYSFIKGARDRIGNVIRGMERLGSMDVTPDGLLQFSCGSQHQLACKRLFLEVCKLDLKKIVDIWPLEILDKKSGRNIFVNNLGEGIYQVLADGDEKGRERRVGVVINGLMKLGEMLGVEGHPDQVAFDCGHSHDALVGLLLVRAPNVRALVREQQMISARGVLAAPSQQ